MARKSQKTVFADPKMDMPFKKLFGIKERKQLLVELLNSLLGLSDDRLIVDISTCRRSSCRPMTA